MLEHEYKIDQHGWSLLKHYAKKLRIDDEQVEMLEEIVSSIKEILVRNKVREKSINWDHTGAKLVDGKVVLPDGMEPVINEIIREVIALYEISYPKINFSYDLHKFLPAFKSDRRKIKRVVVNLLDNSVRALQKQRDADDKIVSIKTNFRTGRNQVELLVADNGPGQRAGSPTRGCRVGVPNRPSRGDRRLQSF